MSVHEDKRRRIECSSKNAVSETPWKTLAEDLSNGLELHPVRCVSSNNSNNDTETADSVEPPKNYTYILCTNLSAGDVEPCDCDEGVCDPSLCACSNLGCEQTKATSDVADTSTNHSGNENRNANFPSAESLEDAKPETDKYDKPLSQCASTCPCYTSNNKCTVEIITPRLNVELEVYSCGKKGWGVRALRYIHAGEFVGEYAGELISMTEAKKRAAVYDLNPENYLLVLREHLASRVLCTHIDATLMGNACRFINHSCTPNLELRLVRCRTFFPTPSLFAVRDIPQGEELGFSYSGSVMTSETATSQRICMCNTEHCTGYLPWNTV